MSGETEKDVSGWSVDTLKQHSDALSEERLHLLKEKTAHLAEMAAERDRRLAELAAERDKRYEQRFAAQEQAVRSALAAQKEAVAAALVAAEKAVGKAEANVEKWRESQNEWRGAMDDKDKYLIRRDEVNQMVEAVEKMAQARGDANAEKITAITARLDRTEGRSTGLNAGWIYLVAGIGLLATIVSIITAVMVFARR